MGRVLLICPPGVVERWVHDNDETSFPLHVSSDGVLSSGGAEALDRLLDKTRRGQVLAIDEAHRFLNTSAVRTRRLHRNNLADYVLVFTASPSVGALATWLALLISWAPTTLTTRSWTP
jgi:hypothetical protein